MRRRVAVDVKPDVSREPVFDELLILDLVAAHVQDVLVCEM